MTLLGSSDLDVSPLCLGGNVFGWTADTDASFAVLDAYAAAGGNFVDTADVYSEWLPGHSGGESETVIGEWVAARGNRDEVIVATKVAKKSDRRGLAPDTIEQAVDESLARLGFDHIDLLYAHEDDESVAQEDTLRAFDALVQAGKVRHIAASNFAAGRLASALEISDREGLARYVALQPHYNLVERDGFEGELQELCAREGLACVPYFGLAMGFLTGKYRPGGDAVDSPRAGGAARYLEQPSGERVLAALDEVAAAHDAPVAAVSLAWLAAQDTVAAPIASARNVEQLEGLLPVATLELSAEELAKLSGIA